MPLVRVSLAAAVEEGLSLRVFRPSNGVGAQTGETGGEVRVTQQQLKQLVHVTSGNLCLLSHWPVLRWWFV